MSIEIYTDGACRGNPGIGGWGVLIRIDGNESHHFGGEKNTTNNRMELMAAIEGLKIISDPSELILVTDSEYVRKGITEWIFNWKRNGWRTSTKKPVKNADLWKELDMHADRHKIEWMWVKGHSGDPDNEMADLLANRGIDNL